MAMRQLTVADILPLDAFAAGRQKMMARVLEAKAPRRIALGSNMTLLFENRLTIQWQVQEMCRVEHLTGSQAVQGELDAYNPLIPGDRELSATLLIEYEEEAERQVQLVKLSGIHAHLRLQIDGQPPVKAAFEEGREREETGKVSSVQFLRFQLSEGQLAAFCDLSLGARLVIDHPAYEATSALSAGQRGALIEDLQAP